MRISQLKFLHILLVFVLALAMQGCVLELGFAAVAKIFSHEHHGHHSQTDHHEETQAPSHKHDSEGQEADFCCDNSFTLLSTAPAPLERLAMVSAAFLSLKNIEKSIRQTFTLIHLHSAFLISSISGSRDKYALSCLLHAPPFA